MNAHINVPAKLRSLPEVVAEYDAKRAAIPEAVAAYQSAGTALRMGATIGGEHGGETIDTDGKGTGQSTLERNLLRSAWEHVWKGLNLPAIASARDKQKWQQALADPPPFTLDNLRATFGPYLENPRATILRGMAEVFADLDPAYKSHEKMKIGVKGLPKRAVLNYVFSDYGTVNSHGENRVRDITNALAAYRGEPMADWSEVHGSLKEAQRHGEADWRGGVVKAFKNGNVHLFFGPEALRDINLALAEFYGDVLPDCPDANEDRPAPRASTAVSKDLQFYPTPQKVIDRVIGDLHLNGASVLEPSCGDGRFMVAATKAGARRVVGVEVDATRAAQCRTAGLRVMTGNFLDAVPDGFLGMCEFDFVVMNPPFYGRHYAKHVRHALRFLKPGGKLVAILPATARYDHGELDDLRPSWEDLPVGSFSASGTNINTCIVRIRA